MKGIALGSEIILDISSTQEMYISRLRETAPVNSLDPQCVPEYQKNEVLILFEYLSNK